MIKKLLIIPLAALLLSTITPTAARAADQVELVPGHVEGMWRNVNELLIVLAANIAMDDEWVESLRNMKPGAEATGDMATLAQSIAAFQEQLNKLLQASGMDPMEIMLIKLDATAPDMYVYSGQILDTMVKFLIKEDSLASVAIYYQQHEIDSLGKADIAKQVSLANQRMAAYLEEAGI